MYQPDDSVATEAGTRCLWCAQNHTGNAPFPPPPAHLTEDEVKRAAAILIRHDLDTLFLDRDQGICCDLADRLVQILMGRQPS